MRKQRQRERRARSREDVVDSSGVKPETAEDSSQASEPLEEDVLGTEIAEVPEPKAATPPSRNATPEDILGLQAQLYEDVEQSQPAKDPEESRDSAIIAGETGGPPPMEAFEERAAMAKEVLRATSDQPRRSRREQKTEAPGEDSPQESEDFADENVRFSEDLTISAKKRPRRKLFGR